MVWYQTLWQSNTYVTLFLHAHSETHTHKFTIYIRTEIRINGLYQIWSTPSRTKINGFVISNEKTKKSVSWPLKAPYCNRIKAEKRDSSNLVWFALFRQICFTAHISIKRFLFFPYAYANINVLRHGNDLRPGLITCTEKEPWMHIAVHCSVAEGISLTADELAFRLTQARQKITKR